MTRSTWFRWPLGKPAIFTRRHTPSPSRTYRPQLERLEDRSLLATFTVINTNDSGAGSLRQAIDSANAAADADTIAFNIGGAGVQTIAPTSPLPDLTGPVTIDGTTQPGFAGLPLIELSGASAGQTHGLVLSAGNSMVRGLAINRFFFYGIFLQGGGGNRIEGNFIGTDAAGALRRENDTGIYISNSANNIIGGTTTAARNVISGNANRGLRIEGASSTGNQVLGNFIGTDRTGTKPDGVANNGEDLSNGVGITINGAPNNVVGGTTAEKRNLISGNGSGVEIFGAAGTGNLIQGNYIGTNLAGMGALPNGTGILISSDASSNTVGGTAAGARNVISGNGGDGIFVGGFGINGSNVTGNLVVGNFIGVNALGTAALGNGFGMEIDGAHDNSVGGSTTAARNIISGNRFSGVTLRGDFNAHTGVNNLVQGNYIGTDVTGSTTIGNGSNGVQILSASTNRLLGNVIAGSGGNGVFLQGPAVGNVVQSNFIGTNAAGSAPLSNAKVGLLIDNANDNTIGGTAAAARNIISANVQGGLTINGQFATGNVVQGNHIGTDVTGNQPLGNGSGTGVVILDAKNNTIGGAAPGAGNVISSNRFYGLAILASGGNGRGSGNVVQGNFIGTNAAGTVPLGNGSGGMRVQGPNNTIGGSLASQGNVISANSGEGVFFESSAAGNLLQGNFIGTDVTGTSNLGNASHGIMLYGSLNTTPPENNSIGGTAAGAGNTIAFNGGDGVFLVAGNGNAVLGNRLFSNAQLGIDLGVNPFDLGPGGVTANDVGDGDTGANKLQNFPVLSYAESGVATLVRGSLASTPGETFRLEFFASPAADPSGFGEGQTFLGAATVTTDASGNAAIDVTLSATVATGQFISTTATRLGDTDFNAATSPVPADTSEFSAAILVNTPPVINVYLTDDASDGTLGFLAPRTVLLDPSASFDAEASAGDTITKFRWNFGDGSPAVETTGPIVHTYSTVGNFSVSLSAVDSRGAQSAPKTLSVATRGTVAGTIFEDKNGNGQRDAGEIGIGGQTVFVDLNKNGLLDGGLIGEPSQSPTSGAYSFSNMGPGVQQVRVKPASGFVVTAPVAGFQAIDYAQTIQATGRDIGVFRTGVIQGVLFDDLNGNGIKDLSEPGLSGKSVFLDLDNDNIWDLGEPTATTNVSGVYSLPQVLGAASPAVRVLSPATFQYVTNAGGKLGAPLTSGGLANQNLGLATRGTVSGKVFLDLNANGLFDLGESGMAGRNVSAFLDTNGNKLFDPGEKTVSTTTDASGNYAFNKVLDVGTWRIAHVLSGGWIASSPSSNAYDIAVTSGSTFTGKNFSGFKLVTITGTVFDDANGNGHRDSGDDGLGNWKVFLDLDRNGIRTANEPLQMTSDAPDRRGEFRFESLRPGTYRVREVLEPGFKAGNPVSKFRDVTLSSGQTAMEVFFANYRPGSLAGLLFDDLDGDGVRDAGEKALSGRIVFLERQTASGKFVPVRVAMSDVQGNYQFRGLAPGTYRIRPITAANAIVTAPADGFFTETIVSGFSVVGRDFGLLRPPRGRRPSP